MAALSQAVDILDMRVHLSKPASRASRVAHAAVICAVGCHVIKPVGLLRRGGLDVYVMTLITGPGPVK